ncbi:MAG: hypothetical protein AAFU77_06010 [Myxococcota bacterium]
MRVPVLILIGLVLFAAFAYAQADEEGADKKDADAPAEEDTSCKDLPPAELTFLRELRDRQRELQEREARVTQREEELRKRESEYRQRITDAVMRIEKLETIAEAGAAGREKREARVATLAKALESLSPKKAAPMFQSLEPSLAKDLLIRLKPKQFGALLSSMDPQLAASLMREVAQVNMPRGKGR